MASSDRPARAMRDRRIPATPDRPIQAMRAPQMRATLDPCRTPDRAVTTRHTSRCRASASPAMATAPADMSAGPGRAGRVGRVGTEARPHLAKLASRESWSVGLPQTAADAGRSGLMRAHLSVKPDVLGGHGHISRRCSRPIPTTRNLVRTPDVGRLPSCWTYLAAGWRGPSGMPSCRGRPTKWATRIWSSR